MVPTPIMTALPRRGPAALHRNPSQKNCGTFPHHSHPPAPHRTTTWCHHPYPSQHHPTNQTRQTSPNRAPPDKMHQSWSNKTWPSIWTRTMTFHPACSRGPTAYPQTMTSQRQRWWTAEILDLAPARSCPTGTTWTRSRDAAQATRCPRWRVCPRCQASTLRCRALTLRSSTQITLRLRSVPCIISIRMSSWRRMVQVSGIAYRRKSLLHPPSCRMRLQRSIIRWSGLRFLLPRLLRSREIALFDIWGVKTRF